MPNRRLIRPLLALVLALIVLPAEAAPPDDGYIAGYAAAVLEREFNLTTRSLRVDGGVLRVDRAELAGADHRRVVESLQRIRGVSRVELRDTPSAPPGGPSASTSPAGAAPPSSELKSGWLPGGPLFKPLIADPRWPHFSAAYLYYMNERDLGSVGAVSFGETFPLYRWGEDGHWWEVGIQAGVFAIFDLEAESKDLINSDFFVSGVAAYRRGGFSALGRLFHQSSHLGDEFLLRSRVNRVNLSYEGIDLKLSYEFWRPRDGDADVVRVYGGAGYLLDRDPPRLDPWSVQGGVELRWPWEHKMPFPGANPRFRPIAAVDVQSREENDWHLDVSARAGIEFGSVLETRKLQLLLEYFRGHSPNGQFYERKVDYLGLGVHFHF